MPLFESPYTYLIHFLINYWIPFGPFNVSIGVQTPNYKFLIFDNKTFYSTISLSYTTLLRALLCTPRQQVFCEFSLDEDKSNAVITGYLAAVSKLHTQHLIIHNCCLSQRVSVSLFVGATVMKSGTSIWKIMTTNSIGTVAHVICCASTHDGHDKDHCEFELC